MTMDSKDRLILNILQKDGRMTASDVSEKVDLSVPAVTERIRKLSDSGVIKEFRAIVNAKKIGYDVTAYILMDMSSSGNYVDVIDHAQINDQVLECHSITGEGSHILKVRAQDTSSLEVLLREIQGWPGVIRTHTMIVMSTFKEATRLEI
ncbi:MAG: Lrp/AsnC family transcriptional regulator [SAR202 cluster bacterium]|nr:AsnC family transcriptional regulator [Candidatus Neomarinimicrobiota bacterium]MQG38829.1 Lrp/AsnC family transcriptional regulator [SAR202 cluster bacterium]|tara:strand:+ start:12098 stop:12547 length:450 start_codon:yes stop_codon:yes gene_type:complete